jgi:hypothetical protein
VARKPEPTALFSTCATGNFILFFSLAFFVRFTGLKAIKKKTAGCPAVQMFVLRNIKVS